MTTADQLDALQTCLAGEHAAVYVFSVLGAQTSQTATPLLWNTIESVWLAHRSARDHLVAELTAAGRTPAAAAPSYELPNAAATPDQIWRAALTTEKRVTDVYGTLVSRTTAALRSWAIRSMDESAVRQLRLRGGPEIFPGTGGLRTDAG